MNASLYRRSLLVTVTIAIVFSLVGMLTIFQVRRYEREHWDTNGAAVSARLFDELSQAGLAPNDAIAAIRRVERDGSRASIELLTPEEARKRLGPDEELPLLPYESKLKTNLTGMPVARIVRVKTLPGNYVYTSLAGDHRAHLFTTTFLVLAISVVIASLVSITLVFASFRKKAREVSAVLSRMQKGDLKARLPIHRIDESAQIMTEFNKMADEIERLVEKVKATEGARMGFFRELTHDLRTPVASLKNLLETLNARSDSLTPELKSEFLALSLKEVDYFGRLINDLLFLAQVTEPRYRLTREPINLAALLEDELERVLLNARSQGQQLDGSTDFAERVEIAADEHLLRRLIRNALENAASFARSRVGIEVRTTGSGVNLIFRDDGPGFSPEALRTFGEKRATRVLAADGNGRLSVGLGSVVMSAVAAAHDGSIAIRNADLGGAIVEIHLNQRASPDPHNT